MIEFDRYLENLKKLSDDELLKNNVNNSFSGFEKINYFLINKSITEKLNLFIKNTEFQDTKAFYDPLIKSISVSLFLKNYCNDKTTYEIGDILINKNGKTFTLLEKNDKSFKLEERSNVRSKHGNTLNTKNIDFLKSCIVINKSESADRKFKNTLEQYRNFFKETFNLSDDYVPSKFSHKAIIITEKKELLENLKKKDILNQIPIQWVTKDGTFENIGLPIDPMIYIIPDYETFREHILGKDNKIETIIIIGENKYNDCFYNITKAIREKNIENVILIGSQENEEIKDNPNFLKWRWTYSEYAKLNELKSSTINTIEIPDDDFSKAIKNYTDYIKKLEKEFSIELKSLKYNLDLYSNVFTPNAIRRKEELDHQKNKRITYAKELILDSLFNQNQESRAYEFESEKLINTIFESFKNKKYQKLLDEIKNRSTLVIPDKIFEIWQDFNKNKGIKVLKWKDFIEKLKEDKIEKNKNIYFLSLFGYEKNLIYKLKNTSQNYFFITYPEEVKIIKNIEKKSDYFDLKEYKSEDRKKLTNIEFKEINEEPTENTSEDILLTEDLEEQKNTYNKVKVDYKIHFQDANEPIILDGDKSVILNVNSKKEKIKVYKLKEGDLVRIYANPSKESLFDIASSENKEGRFSEIDKNSKIWKNSLIKYQQKLNSNIDSLLIKLQSKGCSIRNKQSLKKWLTLDDKEKFPKSLNDLKSIRELLENQELNDSFDKIKKSKTEYRGIMISLGRDLSEEINNYIIDEKNKGNILKKFSDNEINAMANSSAPIKKIRKIEKTEEEENDSN